MPFQSTKTYGHEVGLSCAFRQWRAIDSHCSLLHGYALSFKFTFEADQLDDRNWVQDFGGLKELKHKLQELFDHKLVVAEDDPEIDAIRHLANIGIADVLELKAVGCEMFAKLAFETAQEVVQELQGRFYGEPTGRVRVVKCECSEHGANSAIYIG